MFVSGYIAGCVDGELGFRLVGGGEEGDLGFMVLLNGYPFDMVLGEHGMGDGADFYGDFVVFALNDGDMFFGCAVGRVRG